MITSDQGRNRWFPASHFDLTGNDALRIVHINILDLLTPPYRAGIEVHITLSNSDERYCIFAVPGALSSFGDTVFDTDTRIHYGTNFIVVSEISEEIITQAIKYLLTHNALLQHTLSTSKEPQEE